jgi:anti-sigma B factor antagonist
VSTPTVHAAAEIDASTAPLLREQLREAIAANPGAVVLVDMAEVEFIDSTGLGVIVSGLKQARLTGGDVAIANTQATIGKILHITGLDKVFTAEVPS